MLVKDQMTPHPMCGRPEMSIEEAEEIMHKNNFRHLPIVDERKHLVGLVTQASLAGTVQADQHTLSQYEVKYILSKVKVRDIMVKDVITIGEDTAIEEAARIMADRKISCLPVTRDGQPVGIITDNDLFAIMVNLLGARRAGTRITVLQPDRPGEIARLTKAIADKGGNLSVAVTYPTADPSAWASVFKVTNVSEETLVETIKSLPDIRITDVRKV
jgi:acetoin utilization protein AcuB